MEAISKEHERLEKKANLSKVLGDVQTIIDQLRAAKEQVSTGRKPDAYFEDSQQC
jgi:hypothetical protein